ncbi:hypothetical protein [Streptomyces sp. JJ36]|uniref:hypothetical protein n=1 Tax=Streptomyces sp. JJ36 TaxID=2736645 RepID=UPI001F1BE375|nr:hypothetical protein [Streptomyces sp. JJ36]MCF6526613.1 hypothetical protein [Streptomyces sp. JJ36]
MTERRVANLRAGQRVRAALGVKYLADDCQELPSVEAVEFLFDGGPSILLSCGTDWTLEVAEGRWPALPEWCWPIEAWTFEKVEEIGSPDLDVIISTSDILNAVGEICGVLLEFPAAWVTIRSGKALTWEISRRES